MIKFKIFTESERKLDTLPEDKIMLTPTSSLTSTDTTSQKTNDCSNLPEYKRVYADWKPSKALEQTDVIGTIQAIAGICI